VGGTFRLELIKQTRLYYTLVYIDKTENNKKPTGLVNLINWTRIENGRVFTDPFFYQKKLFGLRTPACSLIGDH